MPPQVPVSQPQSQYPEDQPVAAPSGADQPRMSRRSLMRGALIGGAAGVVVAGGAGAVVSLNRPAGLNAGPAGKPTVMAPMAPAAMAGPLVVYLNDTTSGQLDVFAGEGQTRIHDPALVARLLQSLK